MISNYKLQKWPLNFYRPYKMTQRFTQYIIFNNFPLCVNLLAIGLNELQDLIIVVVRIHVDILLICTELVFPLEEMPKSFIPLDTWITSNIEAYLATIITTIEISSIEWPIFSVGNDVALIGLPVIIEQSYKLSS